MELASTKEEEVKTSKAQPKAKHAPPIKKKQRQQKDSEDEEEEVKAPQIEKPTDTKKKKVMKKKKRELNKDETSSITEKRSQLALNFVSGSSNGTITTLCRNWKQDGNNKKATMTYNVLLGILLLQVKKSEKQKEMVTKRRFSVLVALFYHFLPVNCLTAQEDDFMKWMCVKSNDHFPSTWPVYLGFLLISIYNIYLAKKKDSNSTPYLHGLFNCIAVLCDYPPGAIKANYKGCGTIVTSPTE